MLKKILPLTTLSLSLVATSVLAASDTRSHAMGGTSVASSNYLSATLSNPSLIAKQAKAEDDFGIMLPSINFQVQDKGELLDNIDNFQDSFDHLSNLLEQAEFGSFPSPEELTRARARLATDLARLDSIALIEGNIAAAIASPNRYGGMGLHFNTEFDLLVNVDIAESDVNTIANSNTPDELDQLDSEAQVVGAAISEIGFSYGREAEIKGTKFNWGVTPKFQQVDLFNYVVGVQSFDEDDFDANNFKTTDEQFNIDIGLSMEVYKNVTIGFTASNLIENEFLAVEHNNRRPLYVVGPEYKLGAAYQNDFLTVAADIDLNAPEGLSLEPDSQYVRAGLELNGFDWVQLRFGYSHDLEGEQDDFVSVGLGFSPFNVVKLDLTAQKAGDNEVGVGLQLSVIL
ncbi:conjugal transfer protein TraF [Psychrobium sp. 1_MG-2023]|uniref:conjugal transfer protein TraF n=1 Tax=Psychrobium sp. 1_MG-2023 TaxID=3062624 RepID=UPI000C332EEF|nr:conjugal transfer protein TraF [Psychrobium sp. 1_MG-2023]MDP2562526.1 conjugal transfer protein TraF [Psychrobium sp. 1_MG-2023]PKF57982.1 hypothetical protein CW748_05545 [Alteromonadales bacterium alter-6D02]